MTIFDINDNNSVATFGCKTMFLQFLKLNVHYTDKAYSMKYIILLV